MSKTVVSNTNLATVAANSVKGNPTAAVAQPTDITVSTNQVLANNGTLQGLAVGTNQVLANNGTLQGVTLGTNQFVGNTGSGLNAVTLVGGNGISLSTTSTTLSVNLIGSGVPTGAVMSFYLAAAPSGWRDCDGATIANSGETAALFALIGATLPNLQGRFIRGLTTNLSTASLDPLSASRVLGSTQADAFQGHRHTWTLNNTNPPAGAFYNGPTYPAGPGRQESPGTSNPITDGTNGTPRTAAETRPVNIALRYCIKL